MADQVAERSYEKITTEDLEHIENVALRRLDVVFSQAPVASLYRNRLLILTLCQGSAQHFIDGQNGVKDIDVWAFFSAGPPKPFPCRTVWVADFGVSHLGRHPADDGYTGRRLDLIGRSIPFREGEKEDQAVKAWLGGGSKSASFIARNPVIGLAPSTFFARTIWAP